MLILFRNLSCFSEMLRYLYLATFVQICYGQAVTTIDSSLPKHVELHSTQRMSCNITGTLKTGVRWIRPDAVLVSSCAGATNCIPDLGYSIPEATTTRNVLEIANTTVLDGGVWTCKDGANGPSSTGRVDVIKNSSACAINSTTRLDNLEKDSEVVLMVYIEQYFCSSTPLFQLGNANVTLFRTPTGLDDNEGNVTVLVKSSETVDLYMVCGGVPVKQNCNVTIAETTTQPADIATTPTTGSTPATTPPDGMCKNNKCYWFILILIPITIAVVVCCYCCCGCCGCCRKKKKDKSNSNSNVMNSIGEENESASAEPQVNNDKSDLTRM